MNSLSSQESLERARRDLEDAKQRAAPLERERASVVEETLHLQQRCAQAQQAHDELRKQVATAAAPILCLALKDLKTFDLIQTKSLFGIRFLVQVEAMREEYRTIDLRRRDREAELVDLRKKLNAGDFTAAEQVSFDQS